MTKRKMDLDDLLEKIDTLENYYVCDGVLEEIEELRKQGESYEKIWKHFKLMDEILNE